MSHTSKWVMSNMCRWAAMCVDWVSHVTHVQMSHVTHAHVDWVSHFTHAQVISKKCAYDQRPEARVEIPVCLTSCTTTHYTTLHHTATHCLRPAPRSTGQNSGMSQIVYYNTLHHTMPHCNTAYDQRPEALVELLVGLKFWTITHCTTLHHTETHCNTHQNCLLKFRYVWILTLQHTAAHLARLQHTANPWNTRWNPCWISRVSQFLHSNPP